jgi:hypothetical protein
VRGIYPGREAFVGVAADRLSGRRKEGFDALERAQVLGSALWAVCLLAEALELLPAVVALGVVFICIEDVDLHGAACRTGHGVHLPARDDIPWQELKLLLIFSLFFEITNLTNYFSELIIKSGLIDLVTVFVSAITGPYFPFNNH